MVLQTLTGIIYDVTSYSWTSASIIVKYYLIAAAAYLYSQKKLTKESFAEKLIYDSRFLLTGIVASGVILYVLEFGLTPVLRIVSEVFALSYLGYIFWKY